MKRDLFEDIDLATKLLVKFRGGLAECPHPTKVCFTKAKAQRRADQLGMRKYLCVCGQYHLTSSVGQYEPENMTDIVDRLKLPLPPKC